MQLPVVIDPDLTYESFAPILGAPPDPPKIDLIPQYAKAPRMADSSEKVQKELSTLTAATLTFGKQLRKHNNAVGRRFEKIHNYVASVEGRLSRLEMRVASNKVYTVRLNEMSDQVERMQKIIDDLTHKLDYLQAYVYPSKMA